MPLLQTSSITMDGRELVADDRGEELTRPPLMGFCKTANKHQRRPPELARCSLPASSLFS